MFITGAMDGAMENTLHKVAVEIRIMYLSCHVHSSFIVLEERECDECVAKETAGAC